MSGHPTGQPALSFSPTLPNGEAGFLLSKN